VALDEEIQLSASTAIGAVSRSLRNLLLAEMSITPSVSVTVLAPDESSSARRVNLFLYRAEEHPQLRNLDWQLKTGTADQLVPSPLSLLLYYLLTVYAANDPETGNADAHAILGDAMRVFYEHPVVPKAQLVADLATAREQLSIMQVPLDSEEVSRVWSTFSAPYRLSVMYEVSVVQLDMSATAERPMPRRVREIGVPRVRAPFVPPSLAGIDPVTGPAGTMVTVAGRHLSGWTATVTMTSDEVLDGLPLTGDSFTFDVPALDPGFHQVRVDISHLARATLLFEVT
jgi:Pvc16 N-terminal domain/IPT/TIG domain